MPSTASSAEPRPIPPDAMPRTRPARLPRRASSGRVPIVVGGTGLYFKVLLEGLSPVPAIDPDVRAYWRGRGRTQAGARAARDPGAARSRDGLAPDADRPAAHRARARGAGEHRALARRLAARSRASRCWRRSRDGAAAGAAGSRRMQASAIDARFDAMLAAGALEEVRALLALGLSAGAADHARARRGAAGRPPGRRRGRWRQPWRRPRPRPGNTPSGSSRGSGAI